jgi:hypothetical protein
MYKVRISDLRAVTHRVPYANNHQGAFRECRTINELPFVFKTGASALSSWRMHFVILLSAVCVMSRHLLVLMLKYE